MPYKIRREKDGRGWRIVKQTGGHQETVGHTENRQDAHISIAFREQAEKRKRKK